ncbi:hypothetical protein CABS01_02425 [Colletotrichum abscissum]|uniref:uncharacterized protein n=1 Tax=Colletotrichum abscissum TaxID=1671311 RepID=UPI0027D4F820|nr:uncharacterized protein CABS01_02425 [Colletotrichum abscissum]KAK1488795.1 hypothetical protein CABS01_02425 [Colletotrichum abscissum]
MAIGPFEVQTLITFTQPRDQNLLKRCESDLHYPYQATIPSIDSQSCAIRRDHEIINSLLTQSLSALCVDLISARRIDYEQCPNGYSLRTSWRKVDTQSIHVNFMLRSTTENAMGSCRENDCRPSYALEWPCTVFTYNRVLISKLWPDGCQDAIGWFSAGLTAYEELANIGSVC